jgi:hypothetical protein
MGRVTVVVTTNEMKTTIVEGKWIFREEAKAEAKLAKA